MPAIALNAHAGLNQPSPIRSLKENGEVSATQAQERSEKGTLMLRIKRKRGTEPINALRIETLLSEGNNSDEVEGHTKRKQDAIRDDKTETAVKRRLTDRGVFRLAETVSVSSFADAKSTRQLEQRISDLNNTANLAPTTSPIPPTKHSDSKEIKDNTDISKSIPSSTDSSNFRFKIIKPTTKNLSRQALLRAHKGKTSSSSLQSRSAQARRGSLASKGSSGSLRKAWDARGSSQRNATYPSKLRFIDAVMEESGQGRGGKGRREAGKRRSRSKRTESIQSDDAEMELLDSRFADLLGNYLQDNDLQPPRDLYKSTTAAHKPELQSDSDSAESEDGDYVYDIYYREKETMWGSGPGGASDAGLRPAKVAGHEDVGILPGVEAGEKASAEAQYAKEPMATLVGFDNEDDLINQMEAASQSLSQEGLNDSSDDFDEGEDEDSNDEGFYRNDYPEDEGQEEEEFNQAGWGWSGPRRRRQKASSSDEEDDDEGEDDSGEDSDDLHA
ncbi:hypothetical protein CBS101457_001100 [Exobasidium rhododendri]|nr:hypothetical protein CBS101457_001100 [Exobasidium rhododendri]